MRTERVSVTTEFTAPLSIAQIMADFPAPWCICGGWAIDLFLNRVTRPHKDVDIAVLRQHQSTAYTYLSARGWTLERAHEGKLTPWQAGQSLELPIHTIWCKNPGHDPDFLEVLLNEADGTDFRFRRDGSITLDLKRAFIKSASGLPVLAPEIVLLYKANDSASEGNTADFRHVLPSLDSIRRDWLAAALAKLYLGHAWLNDLLIQRIQMSIDLSATEDLPHQEAAVLQAPLDHIEVVQAEPSDLDTVMVILQEAVQWLASQGLDQWQWPDQFPRQRLAQAIERGEVYVAKLADQPVAAFSLQWADPNIWGDAADDAGYVHRLAVRCRFAGHGIGLYLLRWAERAVAEAGKAYLRLDCMAENKALCAYYERAGFTYRGKASGEVRGQPWRAALYEKNLEIIEAKNVELFSLRAATANDCGFLYHLKVATMKEYVAATWGWDDADQEESFRQRFNADGWSIIVMDNQDIGALRVGRKETEINLVNIHILPQYQKHGLGSRIISSMLEEARNSGMPVTLQVLKVNPARGLYERLGFTVIGETETHYLMSTT